VLKQRGVIELPVIAYDADDSAHEWTLLILSILVSNRLFYWPRFRRRTR